MGLTSGSATYTRYSIHRDGKDPLEGQFRSRFEERVQKHAFVPLTVNDDEDQRLGWCDVNDPFELNLHLDRFLYADHVHLGVRIDKWRLPRNVFKARVAQAEQDMMDKLGVGRLSRAQREDIAVFVTRALRKETLPGTRHIALSWELSSGVVRVFTTTKTVLGLVEPLFEATFGAQLLAHGVAALLIRDEAEETTLDALARLEPAAVHRSPDAATMISEGGR